ncbi:hypothetical protein KIS4809_2991 [Bacillus sp. ZZV12-4809]|nr:hypothetical protein KIS4809_2991 [Bacillus sp. ZZV12-4809]
MGKAPFLIFNQDSELSAMDRVKGNGALEGRLLS